MGAGAGPGLQRLQPNKVLLEGMSADFALLQPLDEAGVEDDLAGGSVVFGGSGVGEWPAGKDELGPLGVPRHHLEHRPGSQTQFDLQVKRAGQRLDRIEAAVPAL